MPAIIALTCPVCGAPFKPGDEKCSFCGAYIFIRPDLPKLEHHTLNQAVIQEHIKEFRQRIRADAYDESARYGLGMAYFSLGLTSEAVDELTQAAKLMPENPSIQAQLAVALRDAYKAGNTSAREQMHSRLQRALLLEPRHNEALLLKIDLLLDDQGYHEAVKLYQDLSREAQDRIKPRLVAALTNSGRRHLLKHEWRQARSCWERLDPIDPEAAKELILQFLNQHPSLVPNRVRANGSFEEEDDSEITVEEPLTREERRALFKVFGSTFLAAVAGLVIGLVQFVIVGIVVLTRENASSSGVTAIFFMASFVLMLASPLIAATLHYKRGGNRQVRSQAKSPTRSVSVASYKKCDILIGAVDDSTLLGVSKEVMRKVLKREMAMR